MTIKNKEDYYTYIIKISIWLLLGFIIIQILSTFSVITCILFLVVEVIFLSGKFTQKVSIDTTGLEIVYYQFLFEKKLSIPRNKLTIQKRKTGSFRSPSFFVLNIMNNKKEVYRVDSRDGFNEDDLDKIISYS